ncbi:MAG: hypothetical protein ACRD3W_07395, partial [Terriglobales bacterium]
ATHMQLRPDVQVGDRVFLLGWKHLFGSKTKPRKYGFVERIDGGYVYIRPTNWPKRYPPFELYRGEFRVEKRFASRVFTVGQRVRLRAPQQLDWGKARPRQFARVVGIKGPYLVVEPIGLRGTTRQFYLFASQLAAA